jgi:transcription elongation factor Elf1
MNEQQELKPCPFCGNLDVQVDGVELAFAPLHKENYTVNAFIRCGNCPCDFHMQFESKQKDWQNFVASAWNQRMLNKPKSKERRNTPAAGLVDEATNQTDLFGGH